MKLNIATGKSRTDTRWQNKQITWEQFTDKIKTTTRTFETQDEYFKFDKERQDQIKDIGGFVGGHLSGGRRLKSAVTSRSFLSLDADDATPDFWLKFCIQFDCTAALYSTHKHTEENPRFRLLIPLSREVFVDEYYAICRRVASNIGIDMFDYTGYQPHRVMYWPSTSKDAVYVYEEQKGPLMNPDDVLGSFIDWQDVSEWPIGKKENKIMLAGAKKQGEPTEKPGLIGAFCRAYGIDDAMNTFLSEVYLKTDVTDRYTFLGGSTSAGVIAYEDKFVYSHHSTDAISGMLCNSFDLVRLNKYGINDNDEDIDRPINKKTSYVMMCDFVASDSLVKQQLGELKLEQAQSAFTDIETVSKDVDLEWLKEMDVDRKGNYLSTINNVALILEKDPIFFENLYFDDFEQNAIFKRRLPWRKVETKPMLNDNDLANIENYIEKVYKLSVGSKLLKGLLVVLEKHRFHPIVTYLRSLKWDGKERLENMLIDYLGANNSNYTKEVTKKALVAAVARVMVPGIKFDNVLTLVGKEGQGKSMLFDKLGGKWFSDSFNMNMLASKEAYEQIQGVWLIEIGELAGMAKAEVEKVKSFIAARQDRYRSPFAKTTEHRLRQCVFVATTNLFDFLKSQSGNRRFWPVATFENKPEKNVFKIAQEEVNQIWAEAVVLFDKKESLYLSDEIASQATLIQEDYTEENPMIERFESYLSMLIPENWYDISKYDKIEIINEYDTIDKTNFIEKTKVSKYELWEIALGKKDELDTYHFRRVKQAMSKVKGWLYEKDKLRFGNSYARTKGDFRKEYTLDSILK